MKKNVLIIIVIVVAIALAALVYYQFYGENKGLVDTGGDESLRNIIKNGKIVVATYPEFSPMTFHDDKGNSIGYDLDLINVIAKEIGVEIEIKDMNFPDLFDAVKQKEADIAIASITITPERSKTVLFSIPYFTSGQSIIVRKDYNEIQKPEDFIGKKIAAIRDTTCEEAAASYLNHPSEVYTHETFNEEIQSLRDGKVDAVVHDYVVAAYLVKNDPSLKLIGDPFTQEYYGIMSNIENKNLVEKINELLREIKRDGTLKNIDIKWFGN